MWLLALIAAASVILGWQLTLIVLIGVPLLLWYLSRQTHNQTGHK